MVKSVAQLAAEGDQDAQNIQTIMNSDAYLRMNGSEESQQARAIVEAYFARTYGTGPAEGTVQNNTIGRGDIATGYERAGK